MLVIYFCIFLKKKLLVTSDSLYGAISCHFPIFYFKSRKIKKWRHKDNLECFALDQKIQKKNAQIIRFAQNLFCGISYTNVFTNLIVNRSTLRNQINCSLSKYMWAKSRVRKSLAKCIIIFLLNHFINAISFF